MRVGAILFLALSLPLLSSVQAQIPAPPAPLREFRGAWIATVRGIDWPSEQGSSTEKQQEELRAVIEKAGALGINALLFQVRPAGDAVYRSEIEPWSPWMTGQMDLAPSPAWDPLEFAIKEAHARGIELHAWFNPFRALSSTRFGPAGKHLMMQHPEWCMHYGEDTWMDPGEPGVRARTKDVIMDVLRRYDVDGIHMDDYFYPYPIKRGRAELEFPDDRTWTAYQKGGGKLERREWRRENVNSLVQDLYESIKKEKVWVRFGISPFGIWRPGYPEGTGKGALDTYDALAADSLKWLREGWCDYLAPQLYWRSDQDNLAFGKIFDWWLENNLAHRHIWPGMASERVLEDRQPSEILREISIVRGRALYMPPGHLHWSVSALVKNRGTLGDLVQQRAYEQMAIVPQASWLGRDVPPEPRVTLGKNPNTLVWTLQDPRLDADVKWWFLQTYEGNAWINHPLQPAEKKEFAPSPDCRALALRSVGQSGLISDPVVVRLR
jgi:uncharacterized lipoprotein YddW (UPF0748 family)